MKKIALLLIALLMTVSTAGYCTGGPIPLCPVDNPDCLNQNPR
jgi:hypothetical protein